MAEQPASYPQWATVLQTETKTINGLTVNIPSRAAPPEEFEQTGQLFGQVLPRQHLNQMFWLLGEWVEHLDQRYSTGDSIMTTSGETATQVSDRLGGTWVENGTLTDSLSNVYTVFEKTS